MRLALAMVNALRLLARLGIITQDDLLELAAAILGTIPRAEIREPRGRAWDRLPWLSQDEFRAMLHGVGSA